MAPEEGPRQPGAVTTAVAGRGGGGSGLAVGVVLGVAACCRGPRATKPMIAMASAPTTAATSIPFDPGIGRGPATFAEMGRPANHWAAPGENACCRDRWSLPATERGIGVRSAVRRRLRTACSTRPIGTRRFRRR